MLLVLIGAYNLKSPLETPWFWLGAYDPTPWLRPWSISSTHPSEYQLRPGRQSQVWFIPLADERGVCRWNCEIPWERVPYLSALEVCLRLDAIEIHVVCRRLGDNTCGRKTVGWKLRTFGHWATTSLQDVWTKDVWATYVGRFRAFLPYKVVGNFPTIPMICPTSPLRSSVAPPVFCPFQNRWLTYSESTTEWTDTINKFAFRINARFQVRILSFLWPHWSAVIRQA